MCIYVYIHIYIYLCVVIQGVMQSEAWRMMRFNVMRHQRT